MAIERLSESFINLCKVFNEEKVEYVIIGGFAVILYGFPRFTEDIDIMIMPSEANLKKIQRALYKLFNDSSFEEIKRDDLIKYSVIRYGTESGFYVDFIAKIGDLIGYNEVSENKETIEIESIKVPLCNLKTLIYMKEESFREKDKMDVIFLKEKLKKTKDP